MSSYQRAYWNNLFHENIVKNEVRQTPSKLGLKTMEICLKLGLINVLDLGCGQGRDCLFFAKQQLNVTATDASDEAIDFVRKRKEKLGLNNLKIFMHNIVTDSVIKNDEFDIVFSNMLFQFFNNDELKEILQNISKWLKPAGLLVCSIKRKGDSYFGKGEKILEGVYRNGAVRYFRDKNEIEYLLNSRFSILEINEDEDLEIDNSHSAWYSVISKNNK